LRLEVPTDPAKQTTIDREFLMTTQEIDKYLEQLRTEGRDEGFAQAVLAAYRIRFGAPPAALVAAVERASDHGALLRWLEMVTTHSAEDVAAALRRPTITKRARAPRTLNRLGASTRRAPTSK
jgi:hypothetical protein